MDKTRYVTTENVIITLIRHIFENFIKNENPKTPTYYLTLMNNKFVKPHNRPIRRKCGVEV